jgi:hypothetical protein
MNVKFAIVFSALLGVGLIAAPSTSFAQLKDRIEQYSKKAEQQRKAEQKKDPQARGKKKGKWTEHVKGKNK